MTIWRNARERATARVVGGSIAIVLLLALALCVVPRPGYGQTLALPTTAPDSLRVGQSVVVRPIVRDVIGRPASVARVQAVSLDTTVLRISYATGGQRYTALRDGVAVVLWQWQRTDGTTRTLADTVRVGHGTLPPPGQPLPAGAFTVTVDPPGREPLRFEVRDTVRFIGKVRWPGGLPDFVLDTIDIRVAATTDSTPTTPPPDTSASDTPPTDPAAAVVQLERDTLRVGTQARITVPDSLPDGTWDWSLGEPSPLPTELAGPLLARGTAADSAAAVRLLNSAQRMVASFHCPSGVCDARQVGRVAYVIAWRPGRQRIGIVRLHPDGRRERIHRSLVVVP